MRAFILPLLIFLLLDHCWAEEPDQVETSPKSPWGEFQVIKERENPSVFWQLLTYVPNRLLDAIDCLRMDLGVGQAAGAMLQVTDSAALGYRYFAGPSYRLGLMGRQAPWLVENQTESALGPWGERAELRDRCKLELGLHLDIGVGGYIGLCPDQLWDFVTGFAFADPSQDDL